MIVVPDAGPLIYLAGAGELELLPGLYDRVVVPAAVLDEVVVQGAGLLGAAEVAAASWIEVVDLAPDALLLTELDAGEAAAIPLAEQLHAVLLCDDADARALARRRGVQVVGSLGVLLLAKRRGHIALVEPVILRMAALGMFVSDALVEQVLVACGER